MKNIHSNKKLNLWNVFKKRWSKNDSFRHRNETKKEITSRRCLSKTKSIKRRLRRKDFAKES
jgi:hypothetical protein